MYNEKSKKNLKMFSSKNQPKKRGRPKGSLSLTNEIKNHCHSHRKENAMRHCAMDALRWQFCHRGHCHTEIVHIRDKTTEYHTQQQPLFFPATFCTAIPTIACIPACAIETSLVL